MAAKEKWDDLWAAWTVQQSLDERERKRQEEKRYDTKEEAEAAAGDDRDRDPDYVRSEEDSSTDPTYVPSRKELQESDRERRQINKITANTCIFFQDCKVQLIPSFSLSDVQKKN